MEEEVSTIKEIFSTNYLRYNVLLDNDKYYIVDLFSNKLTLFLPCFAMTMKRKAYPISKEDILKSVVLKEQKKTRISNAKLLGIIAFGYFLQRFISMNTKFDIPNNMIVLIELLLLTIIFLIFLITMISEKIKLYKVLPLDKKTRVVVKRKFGENYKRITPSACMFIGIILWSMLFLMLYLNTLGSDLVVFIMIVCFYILILYFSTIIGPFEEDDFFIGEKIE